MHVLRGVMPRRRSLIATALIGALALAATAAAQRFRGGGNQRGIRFLAANPDYDGAFMFCRVQFRPNPQGDGSNWAVDYPKADVNLPYRLSELTTTSVSKDKSGNFNHAVVALTDPELYKCPFIMMTEVGNSYFDNQEAAALRDYLLKGGFLWADDFWGDYAWSVWQSQMFKALPEYQFIELPLDHALFHMLYQVPKVPQIPSIGSWFGRGGSTSQRGAETATPHARGIVDGRGNLMVLSTFNTDFGDAFEREGENRAYFEEFAGVGYAFGINALLYAMTH